jgi:acetyl-CoA synthase
VSKLICSSAINGAIEWVARAEAKLDQAIRAKGETCVVAFPDTAYHLPVIYSFTGEKAETLYDLHRILARAKGLLSTPPSERSGCLIWAIPWMPVSQHCLRARSSRPANTS